MIRRSVFLAALFLIALGGASGPGAPGAWTVVRDGSTIDLSLRALGGERRGRFEEWHGDITFDPDAPGRTRATVVVRAGSLKMQPAVATRRAIGPAFLDSARFPVIRVELRSLEPRGGDRFTARADVTMKGVTRPVTFPVDLRVTAGRARSVWIARNLA